MLSGAALSNRRFDGQSNSQILKICLPATLVTPNQSDDTDENEADESSDYDTDDNLPLSELKKRL